MAAQLFTIGYEGRSLQDLLALLSENEIETVVDVRELPLSRKRGFSKTALTEALQSNGMKYQHVRPLGNPKSYRALYKSGRIDEGRDAYRAHLHNGSYSALLELADQIPGTRTCLLCFEYDHDVCHRAVITEALESELDDLEVARL